MKCTKNLRIDGCKVFSYKTHVATIDGGKLMVHGHWSVTTSKHVNYVAALRGLQKVDAPKPASKEDDGGLLKSVAMIANMACVFASTPKESNDWKARMLKAGLNNRGLIMPDNWDSLSESEKTTRLDKALAVIA
jgi:hypothetical protein